MGSTLVRGLLWSILVLLCLLSCGLMLIVPTTSINITTVYQGF
jgi:hypothetical protein